MRKIIVRCTFLLMFCCSLLLAQQQTKVVDFGRDAQIKRTFASQRYFAALVSSKIPAEQGVYIFDKDGNQLREIKAKQGEFVRQVLISDSLNSVFVIASDSTFGESGTGRGNYLANAYDIKSGARLWEATLSAERYNISPDEMHMVTEDASFLFWGPISIVNLRDGSKIALNPKLGEGDCDWLDNERIVVAIQRTQLDPKAETYLKNKQKAEAELDSLIHLRQRYAIDFRLKKIAKNDYDLRTAELTSLINQIRQNRDEAEKMNANGTPIHTTILAATRLKIYNIQTLQIELEKDIYAPDGEPIVLSAGMGGPAGVINVDRVNRKIYLSANKGKVNVKTSCLTELDTGFNVLRVIPIGKLYKIRVDKDIFFVIKQNGVSYLLDKQTGKAVQVNILSTKWGDVDLQHSSVLQLESFAPGLTVGQSNSALEFIIRKEQ